MTKNITCIVCPIGCYLTVYMKDDKVESVSGYNCKRGIKYAEIECVAPQRVVTSTVSIIGASLNVVPVKTQEPIPKDKIFDILKVIKSIELIAPVKIGDIVVENVCDTGINIVATRNV